MMVIYSSVQNECLTFERKSSILIYFSLCLRLDLSIGNRNFLFVLDFFLSLYSISLSLFFFFPQQEKKKGESERENRKKETENIENSLGLSLSLSRFLSFSISLLGSHLSNEGSSYWKLFNIHASMKN